jgi:hypothetical protein
MTAAPNEMTNNKPTLKAGHFDAPVSCLITATVAAQGTKVS